ncbi:uncharacterized protein [Paramormyrops kingsleyae]|uniref:uncharacterized protein n=1 Tax=Paramormyrops kingsleyae TaxID=1676925 RepID=UPI003B97A3D0
MLSLMVMDKVLPFLVDTGATYSTLNVVLEKHHLSASTVTVVGFSGEEQRLPITKPVKVVVGKQTFLHPFVVSPSVPVNLLGKDMLVKLGASILCSADGLVVTLPEGTRLNCDARTMGTKQAIQGCPLPDGVTLIQYVDDLLIAAPTSEVALQATQSVLLRLLEKGFKIQETRPGNQPPEPHTAEWVVLKVIKRKLSEPRWTGPFRVTERTSHAVRLKGKGDTWFHWSQCAAAEEPGRTIAEIQKDLGEDTQSVSSAEPDATQVSTEGQNNPLT